MQSQYGNRYVIDWLTVSLSALWITGFAILLAAFSYHHWLAAETSRRLRDVLTERSWKVPRSVGGVLICIGFGYGVADRWWERVVWTGLAVIFAYWLMTDLRRQGKTDS